MEFRGVFAYLNVEVVVDLNRVPEQEDVLHQAGKLPHVAQLCQFGDVFWRPIWLGGCRRIEFGRGSVSLVSRHRRGWWPRRPGREKGVDTQELVV